MFIVEEISQFGYPQRFIISSIENNEINYATASYYLIKKRALVDRAHPLISDTKAVPIREE
jgi:hypothetical protein